MRELSRQELVDVNISILKDIHEFCHRNNIQYSIFYGTLIGALRHKGFIPWDDDADIIMPRPSYERFIREYKSDKYKLYSCKTSDYQLDIARVSDERTLKIEETSSGYNIGIAVDVFPIDGKIPLSNVSLTWYRIQYLFWKNAFRFKGTIAYKKNGTFFRNLIVSLLKIPLLPFSLNYICRKFDEFAMKLPFESSKYVGCLLSVYEDKDYCEKECFDEYIELEFEGEYFMAIKNYDQYMRNIYGNYMTPPPVEKRQSGHNAKFYKK